MCRPNTSSRPGIDEPPKTGNYFVGFSEYRLQDHAAKIEPTVAIFDQQIWATKWPLDRRRMVYPHIAAWLKANEKPLAIVVEATKRREYYNPLVSRKTDADPGSLIAALLPSVQKGRGARRTTLTAVPPMLRLSEGKTAEAWQYLLTCHRLARLVARGGTLVEGLVGIALDTIASNSDLAFLDHASLTSQQLRDCLKDLQSLTPMPPIAEKIDLTERYWYLDSLKLIRRKGFVALEGMMLDGVLAGTGRPPKKASDEELRALAMIDWDPAIQSANKWYDRFVVALRLKTRAERTKELDKIETEVEALKKEAGDVEKLSKLLLEKPDKNAGLAINDILLGLVTPSLRKVQDAHDRREQIERNLHVAFALAAYRADNARYPAKLDDLAPKYLATIPDDIFSGKALIYTDARRRAFLVYSVGVNGKDDDGHWYDDTPPGDDPRVRLPLPPLKKN